MSKKWLEVIGLISLYYSSYSVCEVLTERFSDICVLRLDAFPLVDDLGKGHVHVDVLVCQLAHLLHVDFLEQRADVDTLDKLDDLCLQALVIGLILLVLLNCGSILSLEFFIFSREPFLLTL